MARYDIQYRRSEAQGWLALREVADPAIMAEYAAQYPSLDWRAVDLDTYEIVNERAPQ